LLSAGMWPHTRTTRSRTAVLSGPAPSDRFPLLSDAQVLGFLCAESLEPHASIDAALRYLRLDANDPAALQRARQVALIFSEWRLGANIADTGRSCEPVGASCRLPRCRTAMTASSRASTTTFVL
jgi:hypothetical protein